MCLFGVLVASGNYRTKESARSRVTQKKNKGKGKAASGKSKSKSSTDKNKTRKSKKSKSGKNPDNNGSDKDSDSGDDDDNGKNNNNNNGKNKKSKRIQKEYEEQVNIPDQWDEEWEGKRVMVSVDDFKNDNNINIDDIDDKAMKLAIKFYNYSLKNKFKYCRGMQITPLKFAFMFALKFAFMLQCVVCK